MLLRLPDSPTNAKFLTDTEREIAIERMRANQTGFKNTKIDRSQIAEAFLDIKTWLLVVLILASNIPNGGFTTVGPTWSFCVPSGVVGISRFFAHKILKSSCSSMASS